VPAVTTRNHQLTALMGELGKIASEVGDLNTVVASPTPDTAREVSARVLALSERALGLSSQAHEAELEEVATQAHALHQKLDAIGKKLQKAGGPTPN
jgi:DNA anti-recombination protein RmuC